jgi:hypothetical protein
MEKFLLPDEYDVGAIDIRPTGKDGFKLGLIILPFNSSCTILEISVLSVMSPCKRTKHQGIDQS